MTKRIVTLQRVFRCCSCGRIDVYDVFAEPVHCGRPMDAERELFRGGDPEALRIDLVEYVRGGADDLQVAESVFTPPSTWITSWEVWCLKPGRQNGERIGWLGETLVGYAYQMVPGIPSYLAAGLVTNREDALAAILGAIHSS